MKVVQQWIYNKENNCWLGDALFKYVNEILAIKDSFDNAIILLAIAYYSKPWLFTENICQYINIILIRYLAYILSNQSDHLTHRKVLLWMIFFSVKQILFI